MQTTPIDVIDYDANGYDYREYWSGRDYELWAEQRVLRRLVPKLGRPPGSPTSAARSGATRGTTCPGPPMR
ncbi:hypothetical protein ACFQZ4_52925 [Catellatospora coxensis]